MTRPGIVIPAVSAGAIVTLVAALALGSVPLPFGEVVSAILHRLGAGGPSDPSVDTIVWDLRLPRALLAFVVGAGLSIVGVAMQALVRNPLAEPYILGLSSGAGAGASLFYLGFLPAFLAESITLPLAAFAGGLATMAVVYAVARDRDGVSVTRLLLAGVAMSALMASVTAFVTFASPDPNRLRAVLFWLLGSLSGARWDQLLLPSAVTAGALVALTALSRPLDTLLLGEEPAIGLGVPVERVKKGLIVLAALVTGSLVARSGAIGFVGLIIPHAVRSLVGVPHRRVVPVAFLAGGTFLVWADILARSLVEGQDLPVGIVTAAAGVPFFLVLLRRHRYPFG
jgi:iron complex transport system permease protein